MKNIENINFFTLLGLAFIGWGFLALILAMAGFFYVAILTAYAVLAGSGLIYAAIINRQNLRFKRDVILVGIISLAAIILFSHFTAPTVFSGRDQGSFSNAAIALSQNHGLKYSFPAEKEFFKIYGEGEALNFPGFNYDSSGNLISHFPLGYISWLAAFYSFLGLAGFIVANAVAFFIFLVSFYLLAKNYLAVPAALAAFFLVVTSFVFSWFFKFTLSENLALALIWFGLLQFILFLKQKEQKLFLLSFILSFGLLAFVRIETIAFVFAATIVILVSFKDKKKLTEIVFDKKIFFPMTAIIILFLLSFKINSAFYITFAKGFLDSFFSHQNDLSVAYRFFSKASYLARVFYAYSLITYLVIGFLGFIYFLKNKKFSRLIPYFILLPSFIYLINPSVSADHPWMLRRYVFAVIPISFLYTFVFLDALIKKKIYFYLALSLLFITNLAVFIPYLPAEENKNLLPQIENLSANFEKDDLVLVDRLATGDGWSMMSGPLNLLYQKQAVYFFNPDDIKKIDLAKFSQVYFIIPDENIGFYEKSELNSHLVPVKDYRLENSFFTSSENQNDYKVPVSLPKYQKKTVYGKIYQYGL